MKWSDLRVVTVESQNPERIEEQSILCPLCDFRAPSERILNRHLAVEHPEGQTITEDPTMIPAEFDVPVQEAVRPSHVRAEIMGHESTDGNQINAVANLIEAGIDQYLANPQTTQYVKVWHENNHVHVKMTLEWTPITGPEGVAWATVRIGMDGGLVRFPRELVQQVQEILVQRYERAGWIVKLNNRIAYFTHPE